MWLLCKRICLLPLEVVVSWTVWRLHPMEAPQGNSAATSDIAFVRDSCFFPLEKGKEKLYGYEVWSGSFCSISLVIKHFKVVKQSCRTVRLHRGVKNIEPTSMWIRGDRQVIETMEKIFVSNCELVTWALYIHSVYTLENIVSCLQPQNST